ncbi:hypothetical protein [Micromonospora saelicesensis]|uniref:Uncharacterized protein n=1 Tax=Micromonospora saelicesensis TaxID=285676 RepID=A0A1C5AFG2_9ACTN|nr:hypothetical protein [Micromonospora saelicesensis]SCF43965.1 hypothetical protein GA0070561_0174 [Micromonospora saelicesensis]
MIQLPEGYSWAEPLNGGESLAFDRNKHGDEWIDFVFQRLGETVRSSGYQMSSHDHFPGGHIYQLAGSQLRSALWLILPSNRGPVCVVLGREPQHEDDIEPWREAVAHAVRQIGTAMDFGWWAIIGPDPKSRYSGSLRLSSPSEVGGLKLDPSPEMFFEYSPSRFNLFSANGSRNGLVKVRGTSAAYTWAVAAEDAAKRLRLLCAMLSVESRVPWMQRCSISPLTRTNASGESEAIDGEDIEFPVRSPWDRDEIFSPEGRFQVNDVTIPDWIPSRWSAIASDAGLLGALINYHEGLLMMEAHPSYAALAFVAVIEALGNRTVKKLPRCAECRSVRGSGQRFREALAKVIPAEEAEYFGRKFYDRRSRTAHEGILHGAEPTFGAFSHWTGISDNSVRDFEALLHSLSAVTRRILLVEVAEIDVPRSSLLPPPIRALPSPASTSPPTSEG